MARGEKGKGHTGIRWEIMIEIGGLEDIVVNGRIILETIFSKLGR